MSKNVVFISIFDITRLLYAVSQRLQQDGHRIFWISTSRNWTAWLREQGVAAEDILVLRYTEDDFLPDDEKKNLQQQIVACEGGAKHTVNQCLIADRFVGRLKGGVVNDYVYLYYRDIKRFLVERQADVVFGEPTNLNELVTDLVCEELGISFLAPWSMRYPPDRMIFTPGIMQGRLVSGEGTFPDGIGAQLLKTFEESRVRPRYFEKLSRAKVVTPAKLWRSACNRVRRGELTRQPNLTHIGVAERAALMIRRMVNGFYLRHLMTYDELESINGRLAFFGLHVQPENSIDVQGAYFSDQLKLIKDIRRALPFDVILVIKEHPNFLGLRGRSFMNSLKQIPNLKIVKHDVSTFAIYQKACVVFTVSGTVGYEAGMLGVPAVVFSEVYFSGLSSVYPCPEISRLKALLDKIFGEGGRDFEADCREMERLMAGSFDAYWDDPYTMPKVMEADNIVLLQKAFSKVVQELDQVSTVASD